MSALAPPVAIRLLHSEALLSPDRRRLEPGAQPERVVDDDCTASALDQAFSLHGVDLA